MLETTTVGSLPIPEYLTESEKLWPAWRLSGEELVRAKERAAIEWLRHQEEAGIDILTAGEQHRIHFVHGFLENIQGIHWEKKTPMGIRDNRYIVDVPTVTGPLSTPHPSTSRKRSSPGPRRTGASNSPCLALNDSRIDQISLECADSRVPLSLMSL